MSTATPTKEDSSSKVVKNHPLICLKRLKEELSNRAFQADPARVAADKYCGKRALGAEYA
jgi:hypothetical protein